MNPTKIERFSPDAHAPQSHNRSEVRPLHPEPDILGYEDGLVHEHNWACRERGAAAHD